ncbi:MAG: hypothetical protein CBB95_09750 [Alteromonas sp. TMED35]|mgnify:FL=1|uniref:conjugative transfer system coupling protein TraD n=1 Tax=uncultured Alteromonas sp. TaxID=179113 RepID=UPI000B738EE5|nr:MAG: hypothetical protein CBB95_09750 [Alteromonas sp. TMED35]|tara:strand:- start:17278 stop:19221 length:1944 start_codon:yes stop_codon:yes gene_type:complete
MHKLDPRYSEQLFRPVFELNVAAVWFAAGILTPVLNAIYVEGETLIEAFILSAIMFTVAVVYGYKSIPLLDRQLRLTTNKMVFYELSKLRKTNQLDLRYGNDKKKKKKDRRSTYMGRGFKWGAEHANRAYQVADMDSDFSQVKLPFFLNPVAKMMAADTEKLGGAPWIHGMGNEEEQIINETNWYGHSCITGNVGTGKTTLLKLMSLNALHLGNTLLVLDPKNDKDWQATIKHELEYLGKADKFYHLHPSSPSTSCRIPLLNNYTRITEIAARVAPLMGNGPSSKPFQDFAYGIIYATSLAFKYLGEPIRLTSIQKVIASDRRGLAMRVMDKYYKATVGDEYATMLAKELKELNADRLAALGEYYIATLSKDSPCPAVEKMIEFALHDDGHYVKMVTTLRPVLTALTAEPLDELFSPVETEAVDDDRPIIDIAELMETGGCLYISLDSLTDGTTASFLSRLILAEAAAVAGDRYNHETDEPRRVTIANDEVHASIENNDALFNILSQGRAASMQMILATQTISDIASKTDQATADRFLGLCNNFISMRTTDPKTQEYVSSQFSKASVTKQDISTNSSSDVGTSMLSFSAGYKETLSSQREDAFPPTLLGDLPILQYVARLADGKKLKMRLPIIKNDDKEGERAPWLH